MAYFCDNCRSDIETYDLFMMPMTATINGVEYKYVGRMARCTKCGCEIFVPEIIDFNLDSLRKVIENGNDRA